MVQTKTQQLPGGPWELGEGPHYDGASDTAWWLDIAGRSLLEHRFGDGQTRTHCLPTLTSLVARVDDGCQLLATEDGLYLRDKAQGGLSLLVPLEADNRATRSNDGRVHPGGCLWIGTMGKKAQRGAGTIYWSDGRSVRPLFRDISIPNAICFSPDGAVAYFADTALNTIWRVAVDAHTALPQGEPEVFLQAGDLPLGGKFDGAVTDADGALWSAAWGGSSVSGFTPQGALIRTCELPAVQATCPCFVGPALDRLLVTTAWEGYSPARRAADPGAGFTYVIEGGFNGRADTSFVLAAPERSSRLPAPTGRKD